MPFHGQNPSNRILFIHFPIMKLAAAFSRSPQTCKRSLNELEQAGMVMRMFVAATKAKFLAERNNSIRNWLAAAKTQEPIMLGHDLSGKKWFCPETRHMITLEVQKDCFVGLKGKRFRFYLFDESYRNAKHSEREGKIKIKSHAAVVVGKLYPDKKSKQQEW